MNTTEKENIQNSFKKIKEDMDSLNNEILNLKKYLGQTNKAINYLNSYLSSFIAHKWESSTSSADIQQIAQNPADNPSYKQELSLKSPVSIGNEGVPTHSQQIVSRYSTEEKVLNQPEQHTPLSSNQLPVIPTVMPQASVDKTQDINLNNLSAILEDLKKELKQKFKNLTNKELLVFSLIYTLGEELGEVSYKDIAMKANLTEGSVRDYISRLEHKGIPLLKEKKNNKMILLKIPDELKHISTLDNLTKLNKN
jgi:predicted transcriptional regulator